MDKDLRISELEERVAQLEAELLSTKEHLKRYTAPESRKEYYQNNKEDFFIDCLQSDPNERQYLYNDWIEDFFTITNN